MEFRSRGTWVVVRREKEHSRPECWTFEADLEGAKKFIEEVVMPASVDGAVIELSRVFSPSRRWRVTRSIELEELED